MVSWEIAGTLAPVFITNKTDLDTPGLLLSVIALRYDVSIGSVSGGISKTGATVLERHTVPKWPL